MVKFVTVNSLLSPEASMSDEAELSMEESEDGIVVTIMPEFVLGLDLWKWKEPGGRDRCNLRARELVESIFRSLKTNLVTEGE